MPAVDRKAQTATSRRKERAATSLRESMMQDLSAVASAHAKSCNHVDSAITALQSALDCAISLDSAVLTGKVALNGVDSSDLARDVQALTEAFSSLRRSIDSVIVRKAADSAVRRAHQTLCSHLDKASLELRRATSSIKSVQEVGSNLEPFFNMSSRLHVKETLKTVHSAWTHISSTARRSKALSSVHSEVSDDLTAGRIHMFE